ncbi:protein of unknown function [Burkholderia multivorans]
MTAAGRRHVDFERWRSRPPPAPCGWWRTSSKVGHCGESANATERGEKHVLLSTKSASASHVTEVQDLLGRIPDKIRKVSDGAGE